MAKRIALLAPGSIGAPVGGLLTKAGHDVVLIDQWAAHVEAMKADGLRMTIGTRQEPEGEITVPVRAYHLYEVALLRWWGVAGAGACVAQPVAQPPVLHDG